MNRILMILLLLFATGCKGKTTADTAPPPYVSAAAGDELFKKVKELNARTIDLVDKVHEHDRIIDLLERRSASTSRSRSVDHLLDGSLSLDTSIPPSVSSDRAPDEIVLRRPRSITVSDPIFLPPDHLAVKFGKFKEKTNTRFTALEESQSKQDEKLTQHEAEIKRLEAEVNKLREKVGLPEATKTLTPKVEAPAEKPAPATAEAPPS
jgi:uncharacterized protein YlxW (UPF0749 family)